MTISTDSINIQAYTHSQQKELFPPHLNPGNTLDAFDEITEKHSFQDLHRQFLPKPRLSGLLTQDNNTVYATSYNSLDAMDLTKCIDNRQSMARSSTRFSMGMDLTDCIDNRHYTARNSTKFSVGMDLTECVDNPLSATSNATRFSLGMDMTNVVGKTLNAMSLSNEGMDLTKAVASHEPYTDERAHQFASSCTNFSDGVSLDDSNALELTDAINDPRVSAMSMLYSVSNKDLNKNAQHSVPDKTRYSLGGMDLTNAAISNFSSARRKSTRYSLSNMDLTEVVNAGDCSGLDFTEVINDPKIVAMSTRYSVNEMDLTEGLVNKDHTRFSTNSMGSTQDIDDQLNYSASSETSMDFTKPIYNILQSHEKTLPNGYCVESSKITGETDGGKSSRSSTHTKLQDVDVNKSCTNKTYVATDNTVNSLTKAGNSIIILNDNVNTISEPNLIQQSNFKDSNFQTTSVFQVQVVSKNGCAAGTATHSSPKIKSIEEVLDESVMDSSKIEGNEFSNNPSNKINLPLSSSSHSNTVFEESMQSENKVKSSETSSCKNLQDCKVIFSESNTNTVDHLDVAELSYENMEVSDIESSQVVHSNYHSRRGSNSNLFSGELVLKSAEEASKSKCFSPNNQQSHEPSTMNNEKMEMSELANTNDLNGSQDLSLMELHSHESDTASVVREDLCTVSNNELIKPVTFKEEHSQSNLSVSSIKNQPHFNGNKCIGNNVELETLNVQVKTDWIGNSTVVEGSAELENNLNCSLSKNVSNSEIKMGEEQLDNSLNASEDYQMANISVDEVKPTKDNDSLFMSNYEKDKSNTSLQQSRLEESAAAVVLKLSSNSLVDVSTTYTPCAKNITMTRGGATRHSTVLSHSSSEMSKTEDSLIDHNMEQTSVLESLPLIQRIKMSGENAHNSSEVQPEQTETSVALKTKPHKGKIAEDH